MLAAVAMASAAQRLPGARGTGEQQPDPSRGPGPLPHAPVVEDDGLVLEPAHRVAQLPSGLLREDESRPRHRRGGQLDAGRERHACPGPDQARDVADAGDGEAEAQTGCRVHRDLRGQGGVERMPGGERGRHGGEPGQGGPPRHPVVGGRHRAGGQGQHGAAAARPHGALGRADQQRARYLSRRHFRRGCRRVGSVRDDDGHAVARGSVRRQQVDEGRVARREPRGQQRHARRSGDRGTPPQPHRGIGRTYDHRDGLRGTQGHHRVPHIGLLQPVVEARRGALHGHAFETRRPGVEPVQRVPEPVRDQQTALE